jgi:hypothetical protein
MKSLLRALYLLHLRRTVGLWIFLAGLTLLLGCGVLRVQRQLDLMSLLPMDHPVVKASIEAGVGQQELLWLAAEGTPSDLEARQIWAEKLVERLLEPDGVPFNGMSGEGGLSNPRPVPEPKGASLWPPLLAAGSLREGDEAVGNLVTEQFYALAPALLGNELKPLQNSEELRRRFRETAKDLGFLATQSDTVERAKSSAKTFPIKLRTGYLDGHRG